MRRRVVVNADDFGLTSGVNRAVVEAHVRGIVTSTTAMVRQPAAAEAAGLALAHPALGVGLHVDLGEWAFVDGGWVALYDRVDADDAGAVAAEVDRQVERFSALFGRPPDHLDSHQHVHDSSPVREVVDAAASRLGVPVRGRSGIRYVGGFYGQLSKGEPHHEGITVGALISLLSGLPDGASEVACHPGYVDGLADSRTMYVVERERELQALCDERVAAAVVDAGIELVTFAELP
ncbi:MAG: Cellobiose phosphotransferase system YdjC-like protein [uncultured Acidimicrobiales bacterium]|uniref:Cellobiose phosphotransferase system YdjC-like protein n=1 Tax=uncultured Acidimicrobiales bacterium TaxID=310071 RepID=A0A6J4IXB5_9ACTN|nr:MAG: Cellobiose phosphotransferase system YdjC-like protein [uncultured Acidimicrobiales bacterium]